MFHSTQHKSFWDVLASQSIGFVRKKFKLTQQMKTVQERTGKTYKKQTDIYRKLKTALNLKKCSYVGGYHSIQQLCRTTYSTKHYCSCCLLILGQSSLGRPTQILSTGWEVECNLDKFDSRNSFNSYNKQFVKCI